MLINHELVIGDDVPKSACDIVKIITPEVIIQIMGVWNITQIKLTRVNIEKLITHAIRIAPVPQKRPLVVAVYAEDVELELGAFELTTHKSDGVVCVSVTRIHRKDVLRNNSYELAVSILNNKEEAYDQFLAKYQSDKKIYEKTNNHCIDRKYVCLCLEAIMKNILGVNGFAVKGWDEWMCLLNASPSLYRMYRVIHMVGVDLGAMVSLMSTTHKQHITHQQYIKILMQSNIIIHRDYDALMVKSVAVSHNVYTRGNVPPKANNKKRGIYVLIRKKIKTCIVELMYIGISNNNIFERLDDHNKKKPWWEMCIAYYPENKDTPWAEHEVKNMEYLLIERMKTNMPTEAIDNVISGSRTMFDASGDCTMKTKMISDRIFNNIEGYNELPTLRQQHMSTTLNNIVA